MSRLRGAPVGNRTQPSPNIGKRRPNKRWLTIAVSILGAVIICMLTTVLTTGQRILSRYTVKLGKEGENLSIFFNPRQPNDFTDETTDRPRRAWGTRVIVSLRTMSVVKWQLDPDSKLMLTDEESRRWAGQPQEEALMGFPSKTTGFGHR
jgi:hypothetical protein